MDEEKQNEMKEEIRKKKRRLPYEIKDQGQLQLETNL